MALDAAIYEDVEADRGASAQAAPWSSRHATGVGARGFGTISLAGVGVISVAVLVAWAAWALITFEIGVRLMPAPETRSNPGELRRTIGFADARRPQPVRPAAEHHGSVFIVTSIWMLPR